MDAEIGPDTPRSRDILERVGVRDVVHVGHGFHPVADPQVEVPTDVVQPAVVRAFVLRALDPGDRGVEGVVRRPGSLRAEGLAGVLVEGVVEAVDQHQGSGEGVADRETHLGAEVGERFVPGPQQAAGVVPVQVRLRDFEAGDGAEEADIHLGAALELVVAVGLLQVEHIGQRAGLESLPEQAGAGAEPDVGAEADRAVAARVEFQLDLVQAETAGVRVGVVEGVRAVGRVVGVPGVVGVHQPGEGQVLAAGAHRPGGAFGVVLRRRRGRGLGVRLVAGGEFFFEVGEAGAERRDLRPEPGIDGRFPGRLPGRFLDPLLVGFVGRSGGPFPGRIPDRGLAGALGGPGRGLGEGVGKGRERQGERDGRGEGESVRDGVRVVLHAGASLHAGKSPDSRDADRWGSGPAPGNPSIPKGVAADSAAGARSPRASANREF